MNKTLLSAFTLAAICAAPSAWAQAAPRSPIPVPPSPPSLVAGKTAPLVTDIWVIFKTHCDLGYTMSAEAVNEKYRVPMMDNAIRLIEADRTRPADQRFKWTIPGWPMARNILGPKQDPARKEKIETALREGSIVVQALPCTIHSDSFELEDYVRSLGYSSQVARAYGQPLPISGKMTDVPAHGWIMPTLLKHAGVEFLQLAGNYANRSPLVPHLFWWEGPDGSRILCNYTPSVGKPIYGSSPIPPKDWPAKNYLAVVMTHDNEGPPSPQEVAAVRREAATVPGAKLHFGTMDDFVKAILEEKPELPVVRGDMPDPWIHGIGSMPAESATAREVRPLLPALDLLDTELRLWGLAPEPLAVSLADAYENSFLYAEHTWGANTPGWGFFSEDGRNRGTERYLYGDAFRKARADGYYKKFEQSFDDHRAFIRKTETIANRELRNRLALLANATKGGKDRIVVVNPLPWVRSGVVEVDGKQIFAKDVPASGYKVVLAKVDKIDKVDLTDGTLETACFKAHFDLNRGGISSLVEKKTGRELVDKASPYAIGQFLHERFSEAQTWDYYHRFCMMNNAAWGTVKPNMPAGVTYAAITPAKWVATVSRSKLADRVTLAAGDTAGLAKGVSITFTFPTDRPAVDVTWSITDKTPDPIPEGGWLCFPFAAQDPHFLAGRLGGPINPAKDLIAGSNRHLMGIATGVAVTGAAGTGAALCSTDAPTMSFGEPGLWKYSYDYLPKNGTVFVHLYNNMWNTNFPDWIEGSWKCRVRLWPLAKGANVAENLAVNSWETRLPLLAAAATGTGGRLPAEQAGISVSRKGVLVTAFGANPDGGSGTLLRVWEQAGTAGELTVMFPNDATFATATPVNLRGEKTGEPLKIRRGKLAFSLGAYAPASFMLK